VSNVQKQLSAKRVWLIVTTENRILRSALEKIEVLTAARNDAFSRALHRIAASALQEVRERRPRAA
jgi:hypothetical protein